MAQSAGEPAAVIASEQGSVFVPLDSWMTAEVTRLYSLGYLDSLFLSMRPWTRRSLLHALESSEPAILADGKENAIAILDSLLHELRSEQQAGAVYGVDSLYTRVRAIGGPTLRDSFHLGQTIANDYGRPYESGFNNVTGASSLVERGRFSFYISGEYQHAPAATGYSSSLANQLSAIDSIGAVTAIPPDTLQATIPAASIAAQNPFRLRQVDLALHLAGHEIAAGKTDAWLGPAQGGSLAWSNNAENIYSFRVDRVEPLNIPLLSKVLGPVRYDFFVGSLKGHTDPNDPWVHAEMFAFRPTSNFEFGFQRTVIFGGAGHAPVTLHTFLKSFLNVDDVTLAEKKSRFDPGARFSDFNFSWRLPFLHHYATLYTDAIAHDDVTPISAPRRAAYRVGLELAQLPRLPQIEFRVEAANTDPPVTRSMDGQFNYWEYVQVQGYTNKGIILGDPIGREAKGGDAWLTWHRSAREFVQVSYRNKKTPKDFVPGGTTQNSWTLSAVQRLRPQLELQAEVQVERWKAPVYLTGLQTNVTADVSLRFFPELRFGAAH